MKTKKELKEMAKETLMNNLAVAYYRFEDDDKFNALTEEEQKQAYEYLDKYAQAMAKAIGQEYYTL